LDDSGASSNACFFHEQFRRAHFKPGSPAVSRLKRTGLTLILGLLAFSSVGASGAVVDSPIAEVKATVDRVINILKDSRYQGEAQREKRRGLLRETIFPRFDFQEMAKRSLGPEWNRRTPAEQREFVDLFTDYVEKTYVGRIESYTNEKFIYTGQSIDEPYAEVDSKLETSKGEEITVDYLLHRVAGDWKVYDLIIDDVSIVNNYRSQFNRVISESSYAALVRRIKQKVDEMAGE
jgi:phospholipid transport system substrate-binding protein